MCCFLQVKDEAWWLVLGNVSTSELFALKRVTFAERLLVNMELPSSNSTVEVCPSFTRNLYIFFRLQQHLCVVTGRRFNFFTKGMFGWHKNNVNEKLISEEMEMQ